MTTREEVIRILTPFLEKAGVSADEVFNIEFGPFGWKMQYYLRNDKGYFYLGEDHQAVKGIYEEDYDSTITRKVINR